MNFPPRRTIKKSDKHSVICESIKCVPGEYNDDEYINYISEQEVDFIYNGLIKNLAEEKIKKIVDAHKEEVRSLNDKYKRLRKKVSDFVLSGLDHFA